MLIEKRKIELFKKMLGNDFWNINTKSIVSRDSINEKEYAQYSLTGHSNMYFEDYYSNDDGIDILIEDEDEALIAFINNIDFEEIAK